MVRVASGTSPSKLHPISIPLDSCLHSKSSNLLVQPRTKKDATPFTPKARVLLQHGYPRHHQKCGHLIFEYGLRAVPGYERNFVHKCLCLEDVDMGISLRNDVAGGTVLRILITPGELSQLS